MPKRTHHLHLLNVHESAPEVPSLASSKLATLLFVAFRTASPGQDLSCDSRDIQVYKLLAFLHQVFNCDLNVESAKDSEEEKKKE